MSILDFQPLPSLGKCLLIRMATSSDFQGVMKTCVGPKCDYDYLPYFYNSFILEGTIALRYLYKRELS